MKLHFILLLVTVGAMSGAENMVAQEHTKDVNKLSQELVNPVGSNWMINSYLNVTRVDGDAASGSRTNTEWLFQPVMPIPLDDKPMGLTLMNRPSLPVIFNKSTPRKNSDGEITGFDNGSGIGDLMVQTAIGSMPKAKFGMYMWGVGTALMFPTANQDDLGSGHYSIGPAAMLVGFTKKYTFGVVANQVWSYAGSESRQSVNQTQIQPLYYMQLGNGWQLGDNPTWTFKWEEGSREKYDMPIGLGLFKTTFIGKMPWRFGVTGRYYLKSNENWGEDWAVSFTITPVLKNPFKRKGKMKMK